MTRYDKLETPQLINHVMSNETNFRCRNDSEAQVILRLAQYARLLENKLKRRIANANQTDRD
jgi:hypothetical protein